MTGAYAFSCKYPSTDALFKRLQAMGGWQWRMGDSHWYGDYLACSPFEGVRIRIVDFPKRDGDDYSYDCDIRRRAECSTPMTEIDVAFRKLLEDLPAHNVREIDWFD
jgi:hypothetical protein